MGSRDRRGWGRQGKGSYRELRRGRGVKVEGTEWILELLGLESCWKVGVVERQALSPLSVLRLFFK